MSAILIQRMEGAVVFLLSLWVFAAMSVSWWYFALLILVPDIAMLGYMIDNRWGARLYNLAHTFALPILLSIIGYLLNDINLISGSVVWIAHIGVDRALGFGLKLESGFRDTHLGRIGTK